MRYPEDRHLYSAPQDLRRIAPAIRRAIVVGSCAIGALPDSVMRATGIQCDFYNVNHGCFLPEQPPKPVGEYDFQIIQIPIRTLVPEANLMRLEYTDTTGFKSLFDHAVAMLEFAVGNALRWTKEHGLPAFLTNFMVPQHNPFGRLMPRYDLRNMIYFVEQINLALSKMIDEIDNCYLLDFDQITSLFGKRYVQDDSISLFCHGALISSYDDEHDVNRLHQPPLTVSDSFCADVASFLLAVWGEAEAMWRTLRQIDSIKLIIIDLDDTLWRGVVAEGNEITSHTTEGWPIGFVEALLYAKRRGIMLAVASKNDDARVRALWPSLYGGKLEPEDFASWKVNWLPKSENIQQIIDEINVLPRNVLFIDDNPVERAAVLDRFSDIRAIGHDPYRLRRVLLWSPETQVPTITDESARRTAMVQSQIRRDSDRSSVSPQEFLRSVSPKVKLFSIDGIHDPRFARVLELLNKTNQFNTTGRRWTQVDIESSIKSGLKIFAFYVTDKYTDYGLVGVVLVKNSIISQFVMSCRVFGLNVEHAVIQDLVNGSHGTSIREVALVPTEANAPARNVWPEMGFKRIDNGFALDGPISAAPEHVSIVREF